jgi:transketolase
MPDIEKLKKLANLIRYYIIISTANAGSGHPTSSLSSVELMTVLFFDGFFKYKMDDPAFPNNDRLIFSKGHAAPLLYSLWSCAGAISEEELLTLRKFQSRLEGHPTYRFPYTEAATGSLGQGLSIGAGMALNAKYLDKLPYRTFVLLGDSEMSEGSQWEAIQIAAQYGLNNLVGVLDVNGLGQRGRTLYGKDTAEFEKRISSFGWKTFTVDGHDIPEIADAYENAVKIDERPVMIIAKTVKGKGVRIFEDKEGWHGKAISQEQASEAIAGLGGSGEINRNLRVELAKPDEIGIKEEKFDFEEIEVGDMAKSGISTRKAYGIGLVNIFRKFPSMVVLDAEVGNSTFSEIFKEKIPSRFFEMYIAEQNMAGMALGLSVRNKIVFMSSFAAFLTRSFDQIRMSRHSNSNIKFVGSHAGVSIGEDGASQMGLEDIAMFRTVPDSVVLYPCDGVSTMKLVEKAAAHYGNVYLRTTRMDTPVIYSFDEDFPVGGSKVIRQSKNDVATVVAAGITVHEALKAYEKLKKENIYIRVIDLYSIKPVDEITINIAAAETGYLITAEDHYPEGGLGEAVASAIGANTAGMNTNSAHAAGARCMLKILAVRKLPLSGKPDELLDYEEISCGSIIKEVKKTI